MSDIEANEAGCWVAFSCIPGLGPAGKAALLKRFGSVRCVLTEVSPDKLAETSAVKPSVARHVCEAGRNLDKFTDYAGKLFSEGIRIIPQLNSCYPRRLLLAPNPPPMVYLAGDNQRADDESVGIIGVTRPSSKGYAIGQECARRLAGMGQTIVSGWARGIDTSGHAGALAAGGRTFFVLPTGIRKFRLRRGFPARSEVLRHGAVISEAPPDDEWHRLYALMRNRLTAALSKRLLVIEARETGGTMHTVSIARKIGVPVYVIRRSDPPATAAGNAIIEAEGGIPVTCLDDLDRLVAGDLETARPTQRQFDW